MKKITLLTISLLFVINVNSQINIGKRRSPSNLYVVEHKDKLFDLLEKTTTYFIVPIELDFNETKKNIEEIWTFNTIKFISKDDYKVDDLISTDNSVIQFLDKSYVKTKGLQENIVGILDLYKFEMFFYKKGSKNKNGGKKIEKGKVAEIFFTPNNYYRVLSNKVDFIGNFEIGYANKYGLLLTDINEYTVVNAKGNKKYRYLKNPDSYNFHQGYIKNYFQTLNNMLVKRKSLKIRDGIKNKNKIKELKNQILYAPDWILKEYSSFTLQVTKILKPEELFEDYDYDYKILTNEELNSKILNREEFYYLMHTTYNGEKITSIINSLTGEVIYSIVDNSRNIIKSSDLKDINKLIK